MSARVIRRPIGGWGDSPSSVPAEGRATRRTKICHNHFGDVNKMVVIRRPLFGWGFRLWWREVCEWLALALLVVASWPA